MGVPEPSRNIVEHELARLLAWPELARSPQLARFLDYIVKAKLEGTEGGVKAYSIAVDVFGRPQDFDPQTDPIVRVQARRLRALLDSYYAGPGQDAEVRFLLPVGRYVPEIVAADSPPARGPPEGPADDSPTAERPVAAAAPERLAPRRRAPRDLLLFALFSLVLVGATVILVDTLQPPSRVAPLPEQPSVAVAEFTVVAGGEGAVPLNVGGLALELVTDLDLFEAIDSVYLVSNGANRTEAEFVLTGIARSDGGVAQVTASLRESGSDNAVWSRTVSAPATDFADHIDDVSRQFAAQLGSHRGPLFAPAQAWLDSEPEIAGRETEYLCGLLYKRARDNRTRAEMERASDCLDALAARGTASGVVLAMQAGVLLFLVDLGPPGPPDPEPMLQAQRLLASALERKSTSSVVWEIQARFLEASQRYGEADAAYASALQLNPANTSARAAFGRMLSLAGRSERGVRLASLALADAINPPPWFYAAAAINEFRAGNNLLAITNAEVLLRGDAELGLPVAVAAAQRQGSQVALDRFIAQLLEVTRFRSFGILPVLRHRLRDSVLIESIAEQLVAAGVAPAALEAGF